MLSLALSCPWSSPRFGIVTVTSGHRDKRFLIKEGTVEKLPVLDRLDRIGNLSRSCHGPRTRWCHLKLLRPADQGVLLQVDTKGNGTMMPGISASLSQDSFYQTSMPRMS